MYGEVVMEIPHHDFESAMETLKQEVGAKQDSDLTGKQLRTLCANFKEIYKKVGVYNIFSHDNAALDSNPVAHIALTYTIDILNHPVQQDFPRRPL